MDTRTSIETMQKREREREKEGEREGERGREREVISRQRTVANIDRHGKRERKK